jgi:hypothetical protein
MTAADALALYDRMAAEDGAPGTEWFDDRGKADIATAVTEAVTAPTLKAATGALQRWNYGDPAWCARKLRELAGTAESVARRPRVTWRVVLGDRVEAQVRDASGRVLLRSDPWGMDFAAHRERLVAEGLDVDPLPPEVAHG